MMMGDEGYQYPVYIECASSIQEHKERGIKTYFSVRRRSGGGDSGPLIRAGDGFYRISFRNQKDQQRVLQKSKHVLEFEDGPLVLAVREGRLEPPIGTSTPSQDPVAPSQSQQSTPDPIPPSSGRGSELHPGKRYQVEARSAEVEMSSVQNQEGKQTSVHCRRLGEAKLRLLWSELECGLGERFPRVKVTRQDAGELALEGWVKDVAEAGDWISQKEDLVFERRVSNLSPHLLAFLDKAHGEVGLLGDLLGVEVEIGGTKLHFFSLSVDKLDDAEKSLHAQFKEIKIQLPECAALSSELRKDLASALSQMNAGRCRALVLFGADCTVSLMGHNKEVNDLNATLTHFILQSTVQLPRPMEELPELLQMYDFDSSDVTFHPFTFSSVDMVALEGPTSKVSEAKELLALILESLTPHAAPLTSEEENTVVATYGLCDGLQVVVCHGDITKQEADALVNAANEDLDHRMGVAAELSEAGGPEVQKESKAIVRQEGKIPTGGVVVTTGGKLKCKKLLHAVGPVAGGEGGGASSLLQETVRAALDLAENMELQSVAMPCISSGSFPVAVCSEAIVTAVGKFGAQRGRSLSRIILIDNRAEVVRAMQEACERIFHGNGASWEEEMQEEAVRGAAGGGGEGGVVRVEIVVGHIENQQVDALVSPMDGHKPLSTQTGKSVYQKVGRQLIDVFKKEAGEEEPGNAVLLEGLTSLASQAVFFLNLVPWNDDEEGTPVQVLRLGINNILTSCENKEFTSVALPPLGAGARFGFPKRVVAKVLMEEIHNFKQRRESESAFLIRIAIDPSDTEASQIFQRVFSGEDLPDPEPDPAPTRIFLLGKTGSGKSSLANSIFGEEELFTTTSSFNSATSRCQSETRPIKGRSITLIDTPGLFDTDRPKEAINAELIRCVAECAPGPHAFLLVLKVERYTDLEQVVITDILRIFSEDALKHAVIVFTHGDQLPEGCDIRQMVRQNKNLSELTRKCGGRCLLFNNKHLERRQLRDNQSQVEELLHAIHQMVRENHGGYYTHQRLQQVREEVRVEEVRIRRSANHMSAMEVARQAISNVADRITVEHVGWATGALLGFFFGMARIVTMDITSFGISELAKLKDISKLAVSSAEKLGGGKTLAIFSVGAMGLAGAAISGKIGEEAAKGATNSMEAVGKAAYAVYDKAKSVMQVAQKP